MTKTIYIDTGVLGLITHPNASLEVKQVREWVLTMETAGHRLVVPAVADYELRRELIRSPQKKGLMRLDEFIAAKPNRFLSITDDALKSGAELWAEARNKGKPSAEDPALDGDVLLCAQIRLLETACSAYVVATTNLKHLGLYVHAKHWWDIHPS